MHTPFYALQQADPAMSSDEGTSSQAQGAFYDIKHMPRKRATPPRIGDVARDIALNDPSTSGTVRVVKERRYGPAFIKWGERQ